MKRFYIFILLTIMIIWSFSGCNKQSRSADILICGFSDSVPELKLDLEYANWSKDAYIDSKQPKTVDVNLQGATYQGEYVNTELIFGSYELRHSYKDANKKYFELDSEGNLIGCFFGNSDTAGQVKSKEECEKIADNLISEISNISIVDYHKTVSYNQERRLYTIALIKYVGNVQSEDQAIIVLEETGDLYSFHFNMLGKIAESDVPEFDLNKIKNEIIAKLDAATNDVRKVYDAIRYENFTYSISMLSPSEYILLCSVDVRCINRQGDYNVVMSEKIRFIVPLS